jgi:hypothetical protein
MAAVDHIRRTARCPNDHPDAQWTETPSPTEGTARVAILVVCAACGNDPARIEAQ